MGLREGFTTGSCAAAAALACCLWQRDGRCPAQVSVVVPEGRTYTTAIIAHPDGGCGVIKDSGDDPDITGGMEVIAHVEPLPDNGEKMCIRDRYDDVMAEIAPYADRFEAFAVGAPLLTHEQDYEKVIAALLANHEHAGSTDVALVYMGHGTEHFANAAYSQLENMMHADGYENAFVGTVEGFPALDNVLAKIAAYGAKKVVLAPLMVVAGDHANNDMAGDEADSWKTAFTAAGYEVECVLEGLGQNSAVRALYVAVSYTHLDVYKRQHHRQAAYRNGPRSLLWRSGSRRRRAVGEGGRRSSSAD